MFATEPGFDSPKAALRSWKELYVSARAAVTELWHRKPKGDSFSSAIDDIFVGGRWELGTEGGRRLTQAEKGVGGG